MTKDELNRRCAEHDSKPGTVTFDTMGGPWTPIVPPTDYTTDFNAAQRIIDMAVDKGCAAFWRAVEESFSTANSGTWGDLFHGVSYTAFLFDSKYIKERLEAALEVLDG